MTARARRILLACTFAAFALGLLFALAQVRGADGEPLVPFVANVLGAVVAVVIGFVAGRGESSAPGAPLVVWSAPSTPRWSGPPAERRPPS